MFTIHVFVQTSGVLLSLFSKTNARTRQELYTVSSSPFVHVYSAHYVIFRLRLALYGGALVAQSVEWVPHVQSLCPRCSGLRFDRPLKPLTACDSLSLSPISCPLFSC